MKDGDKLQVRRNAVLHGSEKRRVFERGEWIADQKHIADQKPCIEVAERVLMQKFRC